MADAQTELLQQVPLFSELDRRELETIARSMKERTYSAGETIANEGSGAIGFFVIAEGEASVSVRGEERGRLGAGDYFGEIALIDEGARSATVTAETDLRCYSLARWEFRPLARENASVSWKLLEGLAKKLRAAERAEL